MRKTIGWIEQEREGAEAFFCWCNDQGDKREWLLVEMTCRPNGGGGGGLRDAPQIAAMKIAA